MTLTLQLVLCPAPLQQGQVADNVLQVDHLGHGAGRRRRGGLQGAGAFPQAEGQPLLPAPRACARGERHNRGDIGPGIVTRWETGTLREGRVRRGTERHHGARAGTQEWALKGHLGLADLGARGRCGAGAITGSGLGSATHPSGCSLPHLHHCSYGRDEQLEPTETCPDGNVHPPRRREKLSGQQGSLPGCQGSPRSLMPMAIAGGMLLAEGPFLRAWQGLGQGAAVTQCPISPPYKMLPGN